jgi:hypothetical protein
MLFSLLALAPQAARAEEGPYSNFLVGERSMGLGGAFVAVADDTSALFHNPSGLASLGTSSYAGGLWTFFAGTRRIDAGYRTDLGTADFEHSATLALPSFLGGVVKFGKKQKDGVRPHALGAALLGFSSDAFRIIAQLEGEGAVDRIEARHEDSGRWLGIAYAYRVRPGLAFGLTVFGAQRGVGHDEVELRAREAADMAAMGESHARASTVGITNYQLIARFGMHVDLARELRAGIMFQPPGLDVAGSAQAEHVATSVGATPVDVLIERDELDYHLPTPWELRFGLGYLAHGGTLISIDLSVFGPMGSPSNPMPMVETDNPGYGLLVSRAMYRRFALRGALGFEAELTDITPVRGGIFFERSSAPEVLSVSEVYVRDHVDRVGAALSVGFRSSGYDVAFGTSATLGTGESMALIRGASSAGPPNYRAADVQDMRLMVFIGGGKHAVRQLVQSVFE